MKALDIQKTFNEQYAKATKSKSKAAYIKAYTLYISMNNQRLIEGLAFLKLPNLEKKVLNFA